jgi:thioredoxin reductase (NADPH)
MRLFERVTRVEGGDGNFVVSTKSDKGVEQRYSGKKIVVATGYYDLPNQLGVPGEELPHVSHYYTEPYEFWNENVVVVGGRNSAAEAALDLFRNGAKVTLVHRDAQLGPTIKYWVRPDIENRIKAGQVQALFQTHVKAITRDEVIVTNGAGEKRLPARQVFALTGYHPDFEFIESLGVRLDPETRKPALDFNTLESNVPGLHLAGVVIGGRHTSEIFIENGRFHGKQIIEALARKM